MAVHSLSELRASLTNLVGMAKAPALVATAINLLCMAIGVAVWKTMGGWAAPGGAALAMLSAAAILRWVIQR